MHVCDYGSVALIIMFFKVILISRSLSHRSHEFFGSWNSASNPHLASELHRNPRSSHVSFHSAKNIIPVTNFPRLSLCFLLWIWNSDLSGLSGPTHSSKDTPHTQNKVLGHGRPWVRLFCNLFSLWLPGFLLKLLNSLYESFYFYLQINV